MVDRVLTVGRKVAKLGEHFRLTQEQWAEVLGVHRGTISAYKARDNANPSTDKVRALSDRFGIPISWFYDGEETDPGVSREMREAERNGKRIADDLDGSVDIISPERMTRAEAIMADFSEVWLPTWNGVAAGKDKEEWYFTEDEPIERTKVPSFFLFGKDPKGFIVCNPKGYSMVPRITQGDKVVIRLDPSPDPNSIIVARRPDGANYIKVFRVKPGGPELHSINDDFPVIAPLDGWVCRGVVVGIWKPYTSDGPNVEINLGMPLRG